jgi:hypothetical protein
MFSQFYTRLLLPIALPPVIIIVVIIEELKIIVLLVGVAYYITKKNIIFYKSKRLCLNFSIFYGMLCKVD